MVKKDNGKETEEKRKKLQEEENAFHNMVEKRKEEADNEEKNFAEGIKLRKRKLKMNVTSFILI